MNNIEIVNNCFKTCFITVMAMVIISCGVSTEENIILIPPGVVMPSATIIPATLDVDKEVSATNEISFSLNELGLVSVVSCTVIASSELRYEHARIKVKLKNLQCKTPAGTSSVNIEGYVVDGENSLAGIPFHCKAKNKCYPRVKHLSIILTNTVDMSGFTFVTDSENEKVYFGFKDPKHEI